MHPTIHTSYQTRALLHLLVSELVDRGPSVRVELHEGTSTSVFEAHVDREDVRRVVGRKGRTADAIRILLSCFAAKDKRRAVFALIEPDMEGYHPERPEDDARLDLDAVEPVDRAIELITRLARALVDDGAAVEVLAVKGAQSAVIELKSAEEGRRLVGAGGRTANALREILVGLGGKCGTRFTLEIV